MTRPRSPKNIEPFRESLEQTLALLKDHARADQNLSLPEKSLPSLIEKCEELYLASRAFSQDPIRIIHHFACTGGTLISKCIATSPGVRFLNEIEPFSRQALFFGKHAFAPTDLVKHLYFGRGVAADAMIEDVFWGGLEAVIRHSRINGEHLVLRDHPHSIFCDDALEGPKPSLGDIISRRAARLSVVTVRHPLASFVSLNQNGWVHFEPKTLEEYSKRYLAFLATYKDVPIFKYETFVEVPEKTLEDILAVLNLPGNPEATRLFGAISLSGDSGRSGDVITARGPRPVPETIQVQVGDSQSYAKLCADLGYDSARVPYASPA